MKLWSESDSTHSNPSTAGDGLTDELDTWEIRENTFNLQVQWHWSGQQLMGKKLTKIGQMFFLGQTFDQDWSNVFTTEISEIDYTQKETY